jgi:methanogenesis imperfect marker protein 11
VTYLEAPYTVAYKQIHAIANEDGKSVEILERSNCYGGSAWAMYHYSKGDLILSARSVGDWFRYMTRPGKIELNLISSKISAGIESIIVKEQDIEITYYGLGGGGVGATVTRALAEDVLSYEITESGGGQSARGKITLPRRERLIIGVDDTDNNTKGATWALIHNIASIVDRPDARYISHSLVQLFPVPTKTQNCVSTVVEFACLPGKIDGLLHDFKSLLAKYSVSENTGMAAFLGFDPSSLLPFSNRCKRERVEYDDALEAARIPKVRTLIDGQGLIGALAALPFYAKPHESVIP